jgi:hypothetical protein
MLSLHSSLVVGFNLMVLYHKFKALLHAVFSEFSFVLARPLF